VDQAQRALERGSSDLSTQALRGGRCRALAESALALVALAGLSFAQDPLKDIKAKEPEKRVAAIAALAEGAVEGAEKALISALLDKDWEVVECAASALGKIGTKAALPQLVKTALDAPAMRVRRAAALSLAKLDAARATDELAKQTSGKNAPNAWAALAIVASQGSGAESDTVAKNLKKSQKAKEEPERLAAAYAIAAVSLDEMRTLLEGYLAGENAQFACAALRAVEARPDASFLPLLEARLMAADLGDVVERRLVRALTAIARVDAAAVAKLLDALVGAPPPVAVRGVRLARALASVADLESTAEREIEKGLSHSDADVRAAALHAGGALGLEPVLTQARALALADKNGRVRLVALQELRGHAANDAVLGVLAEVLGTATDAPAREAAAVALGGSRGELAVKALAKALGDREWTVAVCAAVSLGKTTQESAVEPLVALSKSPDWRLRGAAIVGLSHVTKSEAVPVILAATADKEAAVALSAVACAKALTKQDFGRDSAAWLKWWGEHGARLKLWTPEELKARREKFGYALSVAEVFKDLDVIVLESRGDQIQSVLERVETGAVAAPLGKGKDASPSSGVPYRRTVAGKHREDGLQPFGVYVSNCTGEVLPDDLECIEWFVRTGGYLFGSCWSLGETIEKICPGLAKAVHLENELATVSAEPIEEGSVHLAGVFDGGVEPHYNLEGPHMIEVLDRERCEVLVDSPQCAAKYGVGNMTVWFRAGHGLVCDSVNHFNNQGLVNATWLKEPEQRQAYAVDRMALPWSAWRATNGEKWWGSNGKAAEHVFDRTALSLVTNFVRSKRQNEL